MNARLMRRLRMKQLQQLGVCHAGVGCGNAGQFGRKFGRYYQGGESLGFRLSNSLTVFGKGYGLRTAFVNSADAEYFNAAVAAKGALKLLGYFC